jgi:hypothetical protein
MAIRVLARGWHVLAVGAVLLAALPARAQSLSDGWSALDGAASAQPTRGLIKDLFRGGETKPDDADHVKAIDVEARVVTYQVFLRHLEDRPGEMEKVFGYFISDLGNIAKYKSQALAGIYREKVRIHALELIQHSSCRPVHRLYGARVLARLAELGEPALADDLLKVLKDDKQSPAVHYYALRGLRDLLALPAQDKPILDEKRQAACAEALVDFLERKPLVGPGAPPDEVNGFQMFRREGVRALAQVHTAKVKDKVRPALVLARIAGGDAQIVPEPRVDERIEAAIGLAHMQPDPKSGYQPEYAALQIARALGAFAEAYGENRTATGQSRLRPWAIDAARLSEALKVLKDTSGKDAYVGNVVTKGQRVLSVIERGRQVNPGDAGWFTAPENEPATKELFKGDAGSAIKPGAGKEEK